MKMQKGKTTKEYLSQGYRIDQRINSKIEQINQLRELAVKATSTLSDSGACGYGDKQRMESIIVKIVELEHQISRYIDTLIELKKDNVEIIKKVENPEYQTLLELRYLCFKTWEQIAVEMGYSIQHIFRIHAKALEKINFLKDESKCDRMRVT